MLQSSSLTCEGVISRGVPHRFLWSLCYGSHHWRRSLSRSRYFLHGFSRPSGLCSCLRPRHSLWHVLRYTLRPGGDHRVQGQSAAMDDRTNRAKESIRILQINTGCQAPGSCHQIEIYTLYANDFFHSGSFTRTLMKPGTYTVTLLQGELEAGTGSVGTEFIGGDLGFNPGRRSPSPPDAPPQ